MVKQYPFVIRAWLIAAAVGCGGFAASAQEQLPWANGARERPAYDQNNQADQRYRRAQSRPAAPDAYASSPPASRYDYGQPRERPRVYSDRAPRPDYTAPRAGRVPAYRPPQRRHIEPYRAPAQPGYPRRYGANEPYSPSYGNDDRRYDDQRYDDRRYDRSPRMPDGGRTTYSENEVVDAGHRFFGSLSTGLAKAIQWAFKKSGRPNGYILGEDAGGAFIAGLRYGEGKLYTKNHGVRRVFWQGPSVGYDFGGDGNRTMTLVYNLRSPRDIYRRFGGVQGSAYLVGGVSVQFLRGDRDVTLAPIRTGVGLRLGANIGYLKYTRRPTWNPF